MHKNHFGLKMYPVLLSRIFFEWQCPIWWCTIFKVYLNYFMKNSTQVGARYSLRLVVRWVLFCSLFEGITVTLIWKTAIIVLFLCYECVFSCTCIDFVSVMDTSFPWFRLCPAKVVLHHKAESDYLTVRA